MARTFDGTDDVIKCSIGGCNITHPASMAAIVRLSADSRNHTVATLVDSTEANIRVTLFILNDGRLIYYTDVDGSTAAGQDLFVADGWALIGCDKATGSSAPRFHRYIYTTNVWTHTNGSSTANNTAPGVSGKVCFGRDVAAGAFLAGDLELVGVWNYQLSDAQWETLPFLMMNWLQLGPVGLWSFDQSLTTQSVVDWVDGANQTAITGTAIATNHPPVFNRNFWIPQAGIVAVAAGHTVMRRWGGIPRMKPGPRSAVRWG